MKEGAGARSPGGRWGRTGQEGPSSLLPHGSFADRPWVKRNALLSLVNMKGSGGTRTKAEQSG